MTADVVPGLLDGEVESNQSEEDRFYSIHKYCRVEIINDVVNSTETDPATGDPKPIFRTWPRCIDHKANGPMRVIERE